MAQEENVFGCSYSGGGGGGGGGNGGGGGGNGSCRSRKIKPKKVPQRGLGVAQLEKIRLEEEQKQDSLQILAKNASSPSDATTSFLGVQKFRPNISPFHNHNHNSPPPPPSSSSNLSSPNALYRHSQSVPNIEILQENCSVSVSKSVGEIGCKAISSPRLWGGSGDYNLHHHNHHDHNNHHAFAFDLPPPPHHFQPPPSSMVQVNSSSGISPSSVLTSHLEPPSNQSSRHNSAPHLIEEDTMVGMKRSYPFSLESPPPPSLHGSFRPSYAASSSRPDVLALRSSGYTPIAESRNKCIRGSPLLERKPNEVRDDERLNGEFLTLAPPSVASPSSNFEHNHSSQVYGRSQIQQPESSGSVKESFNFFPVKFTANQRSNGVRNGNGEEGDIIDLNLKL